MATAKRQPKDRRTIVGTAVRQLVADGVVQGALVSGTAGGWAIEVEYGTTRRPVGTRDDDTVRVFRNIETVVNTLKEWGIDRYTVDASKYNPDSFLKRKSSLKTRRRNSVWDLDRVIRAETSKALEEVHTAELIDGVLVSRRIRERASQLRRASSH